MQPLHDQLGRSYVLGAWSLNHTRAKFTCTTTTIRFDAFATHACKTSCMSVACAGGDLSSTVTWYWMIPSWYLALQNVCGERFASNNVDVDIATHSGSHVDEDAGADADPIVYDLNEELYAISSSSFCSRSMGATRKPWDDANGFLMMISLQLWPNVDISWELAKERGNL